MPHGFHLIPAHSVVTLAERLAALLTRRENPFSPETVLVMNYAQRVWLQRFLAEKIGICANVDFLSPEKFLEKRVPASEQNVFAREPLAWRIFGTLKKMLAEKTSASPEFLFGLRGKSEEEIFRRAVLLGDLFWRYQNFRPRMIRDWNRDAPEPRGTDPDFLQEYRRQKNLWRKLDFGDALPPAEVWLNLLENGKPAAGTPTRIFAFAPSALPRLHAELLEKLAETSEVFLFYHNLSRDLWTETRDARQELRERARGNADAPENVFSPERGNELLTAWGKAARPLARRLVDAGTLDADSNLDAPPERDSLLHALQREIRDNAPRPTPFVPAEDDRSLRIVVAPNPMREMEILRDELIARFAENPSLRPRDVLVALADLESYAPFVRAVFEDSGIPFSVADRNGTEIFPAAAAFLEILRVAQGELRIDEVSALLDLETVRKNLGLDESSAAALRETLAEAGVRWGADADFRRERIFGKKSAEGSAFPRSEAETLADNNSWAFGLRRLACGYFCGNARMPAEFGEPRIESVEDLQESSPEIFGKFFRLLAALETLNRAFADETPRSVPAWCDFLLETVADGLLGGDGNDDGAGVLRETLVAEKEAARVGGNGKNPPECALGTLVAALETRNWSDAHGGGMLRGKVTFCQMLPMRNIPAKIICIAGLSDGAFPRAGVRSRLDLLAFPPRNFPAGTADWDRSQRDDDCLLFLESILAAQDALLLSYVGRSAGSGQRRPPCAPLAKLRDFLLELTDEKSDESGAPSFETLHHLHGFSPEYFSADAARSREVFSFSRADYATARSSESPREDDAGKAALRNATLPEEISRQDLTLFFRNPAEFICRRIFGAARERKVSVPDSRDPKDALSAMDFSRIHRELLAARIAEKLGDGARGNAVGADDFREREIAAGRLSALADQDDFRGKFAAKLKDAATIVSALPPRLFRLDEKEIPKRLAFPPRVVVPNFDALFRDDAGRLVFALAGTRIFDWRSASETFVCAQLLSAAFPNREFSVFYFAYDEKTPRVITEKSLRNSRMTAESMLAFCAEKISAPPLLFEKTPLASGSVSEDVFFRATCEAWNGSERGSCENFVFGENAAEIFGRTAFPLVRDVCAAFDSE